MVLALAPHAIAAQTLAIGSELHLRLLDRLASGKHAPARVRALVIAPVADESGRIVVPPGATVTGQVAGWGKERFDGKRHWIDYEVDSIAVPLGGPASDTARADLAARVYAVDDARESCDPAGRIVGPAIPSLLHSKRDWAVALLGLLHPITAIVLAATLEEAKGKRHRAVALDAGTELSAEITRGVTLPSWPRWSPPPAITSVVNADSLARSAPLNAVLEGTHTPSDVIALAIVGSSSQVSDAFAAAGWTRAVRHSAKSDIVTIFKAAGGKGYDAQPVSTLLLDGRPPDVVYEKVADSFTKRHHFRMWRWPGGADSDSRPSIWLVAATHDTGMMFSKQRQTFTHRVDARIDDERDKVVSDLIATNDVAEMSYAARPAPASTHTVNGSRTPVETDWRMAVLVLK